MWTLFQLLLLDNFNNELRNAATLTYAVAAEMLLPHNHFANSIKLFTHKEPKKFHVLNKISQFFDFLFIFSEIFDFL